MEYNVKRFARVGGELYSEEYTDQCGHVLAYYDDMHHGMASVTVFDPSNGHSRMYAARSVMRTRAILIRHLDKLGYKERIDHGTIDPSDTVLSYR